MSLVSGRVELSDLNHPRECCAKTRALPDRQVAPLPDERGDKGDQAVGDDGDVERGRNARSADHGGDLEGHRALGARRGVPARRS